MSEEIVVSYGGREVRFVPFGGGRIEQMLRANRFYEYELLQYIESLALEGAYLDVGGWIGTHALFFATYCPSRRVHSFEPRAHCAEFIRRNVEANRLGDKVQLHQLGVSDREEQVSVRLDYKDETFQCRPLDTIIDEPVSVMKIDVEGMEERVLAGADRILRESKPLLFLEAHTQEELARDAAFLQRYGYAFTGRVFNASPTYEFAAPDSPTAPTSRLPSTRSLLEPALWQPEDKGVVVSWADGRLRIATHLGAGEGLHVTQAPLKLKRRPEADLLAGVRGRTLFLQADGVASEGYAVALLPMQYDGRERTRADKSWFKPRLFQRIELARETTSLRIAIRAIGTGEVELDRLALHLPSR